MKKATKKKHKDLAKKRREKFLWCEKVFSKKKKESKHEEGGQRESEHQDGTYKERKREASQNKERKERET